MIGRLGERECVHEMYAVGLSLAHSKTTVSPANTVTDSGRDREFGVREGVGREAEEGEERER